ncbi:MAG TPA: MarR family transcriptional regulator [Dehalococcoidia bacterium]
MSSDIQREGLIADIRERVGREYGARSVLFAEAAAGRLGLNHADLQYLNIAARNAPLTAGRFAELTGLTTGAITGVIDRLESAGFVRRAHDPADRRRVLIEPVPARLRDLGTVFGPSQQAWTEFLSKYTDDELEFIRDFMESSAGILQEQTDRLRDQ